MRRKFTAAVLLAIALVSQNAFAKSLEDVLKEKGIVTEDDLKAITKVNSLNYKFGDGFTFVTADEKFKLSLGGRLQTRFTLTDKEVDAGTSDVTKFEIRRMYVWLKGNAFTKDLTYKVQYNMVGDKATGSLLDAFVNFKFIDEVQIKAGQDVIPWARQEITSSGAQEFVDRSFATNFFKPSYDIGVNLHGQIAKGLVYYDAGVWNGTGQNTPRSSNTPAFNARIAVNPLGDLPYSEGDFDRTEKPLVSIGSSFFLNTLAKTGAALEANFGDGYLDTTNGWLGKGFNKAGLFNTNEKLNITLAEADFAFRWLGASSQAEYFLGQAEGKDSGKELRAQGFYAQTGYFILPQTLQVAVRYNYVDPDRDASNDLITQVQGAISYYFARHNLKLQTDVTNIHTQPAKTDDMEYRLQAQLIF